MNNIKKVLITAVCAGALLAGNAANAAKPTENSAEEEVLHSMSYDTRWMYITVTSHGCTTEDDFRIYSRFNRGRGLISIMRINNDTCGGVKFPVTLAFDTQLTGVNGWKMHVTNKFTKF